MIIQYGSHMASPKHFNLKDNINSVDTNKRLILLASAFQSQNISKLKRDSCKLVFLIRIPDLCKIHTSIKKEICSKYSGAV